MIDSFLNVIIPVDISFISPQLENINSVIGTARYLCKQGDVFQELECDNILLPLFTRYKDIYTDFDSISHIIVSRRTKRAAWFGIVGTVFKHLFGNMDENDAIKYNKAISSVQDDQRKLALYMKENILVTNSILKSYKELNQKISVNQVALENSINTINRVLINITSETNKIEFRSKFNELVNILENNIITLSFKLEDIVNSIMFSKGNIVHPAIISPNQLFTELVDNYRYLPTSRMLPVSLTLDNIHIILNISDVSSYYIDNKIVFALRIPLVKSDEYTLFNCIPFPVPYERNHPNSFTTIVPTSKFIGITKDEQYYCKLDNLHSCKTIYNNYICDIANSYSTADDSICEIELLTKITTSIPTTCQSKIFHGKVEVIQKLNNNKWLYVSSEKSKINVECNNSDSTVQISGTSLITLPSDCKAYHKNTILTPKQNLVLNLKPVIPNVNILNDSCCNFIKYQTIAHKLPTVNLLNVDFDNINHIDKSDKIIENLNDIITKPSIVVNYSISVASICIILVVIILICFLAFKFQILCFKPVTPKPNNEDPVEESELPLPRLRIS